MKYALAVVIVVASCGGNGTKAAPDAPAVAIDAPVDSGPFVEAPHDMPPQVKSNGGPVMASVKIVPIFFHGDDVMQAQVEGFLAALPGSAWWTATTSEYGVGAITIAPSIVSQDTPPTTDDALKTFISSHAGMTPWPAVDATTIYAVFLPTGVTLTTPFGTSCQDFGAYHDEGALADQTKFIYALMPRCDPSLVSLTLATSHEFVEAATDPFPFTQGAYQIVDDPHLVWELTPGAEVGDMCEYVFASRQGSVGTYTVQRTWSNAAAAAGHDPCVPALAAPYIGSAPLFTETLPLDPGDGTGVHQTKGVSVATGTSKTIEVDLFSDAPTTADWTLVAIDTTQIAQNPPAPELTFSWDVATGHNGDKRHLTITRMKDGTGGGSELIISTRINDRSQSLWWGFVAN